MQNHHITNFIRIFGSGQSLARKTRRQKHDKLRLSEKNNAPPTTNMSPKKGPFQKETSLLTIHFQVLCYFQGGYLSNQLLIRNTSNFSVSLFSCANQTHPQPCGPSRTSGTTGLDGSKLGGANCGGTVEGLGLMTNGHPEQSKDFQYNGWTYC